MPLFKKIDYGQMLYEALRNYFSVNTAGEMSIIYKFCAACLFPLVGPFEVYAAQRQIYELVANCKWQIGQLTNVLNMLYDAIQKRIFITQATTAVLSAPKFPYTTGVQVRGFGVAAQAQARKFNDKLGGTNVIINIPAGTDLAAITATIEQIKLDGIDYSINEF